MRQAIHRHSSYLLVSLLWLTLAGQVIAEDGQSDEVRSAAHHFLGTLSAGQREAVTFALKSDARATWSNLPTLLQPPAGILLGSLGDEQRSAAQQLLRASLSSQGYAKTTAIMWLDDVLKELESARLVDSPELRANPIAVAMADNRSSGNYAMAVFGSPGDESWGWKLTGHHLAINVTVAGNAVGFLPAFFGSNPMIVPEGPYAGWMAMAGEGAAGVRLMESLSDQQRLKARIGTSVPDDVFEGPGRRGSVETREGLPASAMNTTQFALLQQLVGEYVRNGTAGSAGAHLDAINAAGWDEIWFSWRGDVALDGRFYYRVQGPRILIEYNRQDENHDHAVVRDPHNDYGEDWLGLHYTESHPTLAQALADLRRRLDPSPD